MSTRIAVRLPDELVAYIDDQVRRGRAASRADLVARLVSRERRLTEQAREIEILRPSANQPDPDDLDGLHRWVAHRPRPDLDRR